jgi:hypothetical protein
MNSVESTVLLNVKLYVVFADGYSAWPSSAALVGQQQCQPRLNLRPQYARDRRAPKTSIYWRTASINRATNTR